MWCIWFFTLQLFFLEGLEGMKKQDWEGKMWHFRLTFKANCYIISDTVSSWYSTCDQTYMYIYIPQSLLTFLFQTFPLPCFFSSTGCLCFPNDTTGIHLTARWLHRYLYLGQGLDTRIHHWPGPGTWRAMENGWKWTPCRCISRVFHCYMRFPEGIKDWMGSFVPCYTPYNEQFAPENRQTTQKEPI